MYAEKVHRVITSLGAVLVPSLGAVRFPDDLETTTGSSSLEEESSQLCPDPDDAESGFFLFFSAILAPATSAAAIAPFLLFAI
jgi:hypothetical protein